jgi:hypothetical protein
MKKFAFILIAAISLVGCDNFTNSPEQKAFRKFLEDCKAKPTSAACVEYAQSQKGA